MRRFAAAGSALATCGLLLAVGPHAWADGECELAFEKWAKMSSARIVPQSANGRGACVPTETVRNELLDGLASARGICAEFGSDQSQRQTRTLLNINQSFVASLVVCPSSDSADGGEAWSTKSAPVPEKPVVSSPAAVPPPPKSAITAPVPDRPKTVVAAPPPAPPTAAPAAVPPPPKAPVAAPVPARPKTVVAAPPPAPPTPAAPQPAAPASPPSPPCLEISPTQSNSYALVNRRCAGHTVLAVIETRGPGGETACRGYAISQSLAVRAGATPPRLNYECVLSPGPCNRLRLGDMFPECDW
jgi:hypothetical protein